MRMSRRSCPAGSWCRRMMKSGLRGPTRAELCRSTAERGMVPVCTALGAGRFSPATPPSLALTAGPCSLCCSRQPPRGRQGIARRFFPGCWAADANKALAVRGCVRLSWRRCDPPTSGPSLPAGKEGPDNRRLDKDIGDSALMCFEKKKKGGMPRDKAQLVQNKTSAGTS